jgi:homoserine O-acetyltransferase/O-succinyltransferase
MSTLDVGSTVPRPCSAPGWRTHCGVLRLDSLALESGGALAGVEIGFTFAGEHGRPVVVALGGISADRMVATPDESSRRGWWQEFVGAGMPVDTRTFSVLGVDFLGGVGTSTGPTGPGFPSLGTADQARAIAAVLDHIGIAGVHTMVGSSYGGMVALAFAASFGDRLDRLLVISAAHESHPMATALRTLQRRTVRLGLESDRVEEGLAIARGIAMTTYRTAEEFAARFEGEATASPRGFRFPVEGYLEHHGAAFVRTFSPWRFLCLSESLDLHRVDPARIRTPATLVAVDSDTLVPPWQMRQLAARLAGPARLVEIRSRYGHDAFLKEVAAVSEIIRETLGAGGQP